MTPQEIIKSGLEKLITQYKSAEILKKILTAYLNQIQKLSNATEEVLLKRLFDNAEGFQLEILGSIVGRGRANLDDINYKRLIRAQIKINKSEGSPDNLLEICSLVADDAATFSIYEGSLHTITIVCDTDGSLFNPDELFESLRKAKGSGIRLIFIYPLVNPNNIFKFANGTTNQISLTNGFGNSYFTNTKGT